MAAEDFNKVGGRAIHPPERRWCLVPSRCPYFVAEGGGRLMRSPGGDEGLEAVAGGRGGDNRRRGGAGGVGDGGGRVPPLRQYVEDAGEAWH